MKSIECEAHDVIICAQSKKNVVLAWSTHTCDEVRLPGFITLRAALDVLARTLPLNKQSLGHVNDQYHREHLHETFCDVHSIFCYSP